MATKVEWRIELLGGLRVLHAARPIHRFETRKAGTLLAFLASHLQTTHFRDDLAERLWPDEELDTVRSRLRQTLSSLRRTLESPGASSTPLLVADRAEVRPDLSLVETDVEDFHSLLKRAEHCEDPRGRAHCLSQAIDLYRGDFLASYHEDWILVERDQMRELFRTALRRLTESLREIGEIDAAIDTSHRAIAVDPLREDAHCDLMRLYLEAQRPADALRQYQDYERRLRQELSMSPSKAARRIMEEARATRPTAADDGTSGTEPRPVLSALVLEPEGGAVPLDSGFYLRRPVDEQFSAAIAHRESLVLVKGPRQIGKTSLLARGLDQARKDGAVVLTTDFQKITGDQLVTADALFRTLTHTIADQLNLDADPDRFWTAGRGWNVCFERFLRREVLGAIERPLVWALDEVDRLFQYVYGAEVFGLFRSWHNERSLDPDGPFSKLTLAIAYATEAHLFIADLNLSPFNVGSRMTLEDFTLTEVWELNGRYGYPLADKEEARRYHHLVGGHPYLVRRGLHEVAVNRMPLAVLEAQVETGAGPFEDHLRRLLATLQKDSAMLDEVTAMLRGAPCPSMEAFWRLRTAGILVGASASNARFRCRLYEVFLRRSLE
ncbi:MAG TPA: AAA-like domain-containing protein [Fimbriimonas sp.]